MVILIIFSLKEKNEAIWKKFFDVDLCFCFIFYTYGLLLYIFIYVFKAFNIFKTLGETSYNLNCKQKFLFQLKYKVCDNNFYFRELMIILFKKQIINKTFCLFELYYKYLFLT